MPLVKAWGGLISYYIMSMCSDGHEPKPAQANSLHYLPSPAHTKFWQERTPLAQYLNNEVVGTRMRRWQRPIHDFLLPYMRGLEARLSDEVFIPEEVRRRRDLALGLSVLPHNKNLTRPRQAENHPVIHAATLSGALILSSDL